MRRCLFGCRTGFWPLDAEPSTSAGTTLVKDIRSGPFGSVPLALVNVNGTLFFRADDGENGNELWKSDGTPAGTKLVKDIVSGINGSTPRYMTNVNETHCSFARMMA